MYDLLSTSLFPLWWKSKNMPCLLQSHLLRKSQSFVFTAGINCLMINVLPANPSACGFWLMTERPQGSQVFKDYLLYLQVLSALSQHFNQHTWFTSSFLTLLWCLTPLGFHVSGRLCSFDLSVNSSWVNQEEKHSSNHLDKDDFSGVFAWGCYCSNNHAKQHPEQ